MSVPQFVHCNASRQDDLESSLGAHAKDMPSTGEVLWTDLKSREYRDALGKFLDSQRADRYAHLSDDQYKTLRALCLKWSHTLVIDGAEPTEVQGYELDIELESDAKPVRHQLPRLASVGIRK